MGGTHRCPCDSTQPPSIFNNCGIVYGAPTCGNHLSPQWAQAVLISTARWLCRRCPCSKGVAAASSAQAASSRSPVLKIKWCPVSSAVTGKAQDTYAPSPRTSCGATLRIDASWGESGTHCMGVSVTSQAASSAAACACSLPSTSRGPELAHPRTVPCPTRRSPGNRRRPESCCSRRAS